MKNCPFCKAQLEDGARFCLCCMRPLIEKKVIPPHVRRPRRWLMVVAVTVLLLAAAILLWAILLSAPEGTPAAETSQATPEAAESTPPETQNPVFPEDPAPEPGEVHAHVYSQTSTDAAFLHTDATCTSPALYYYSCQCGKKGTTTFLSGETAPHAPAEDAAIPATCLVSGLTVGSHCGICSATIQAQSTVPATMHSNAYDGEALSPTCTVPGHTAGTYCPDCKTWIVAQSVIPTSGHKYSDPTYSAPATCSECGATTGTALQQQPINITKPTLPATQYSRYKITSCNYTTTWNGDGTYNVIVTFQFTNISSSPIAGGVWATLSGIEPANGSGVNLSPGQSGSCEVRFKNVTAGNYTILIYED